MFRGKLLPRFAALIAFIALAAAVFLVGVWDLDILRKTTVLRDSGPVAENSISFAAGGNAGGFFTASAEHLQKVGVYVTEYTDTDRIRLHLYHIENGARPVQIAYEAAFTDAFGPGGLAEFAVDADTVPGDSYLCIFRLPSGSARIGLADPLQEEPVFENALVDDAGVPDARLTGKLVYRTPFPLFFKGCVTAAVLAVLGVLSYALVRKGSRGGYLSGMVTFREGIRPCLMPVLTVPVLVFLYEVWGMKRFDMRMPDLLVFTAAAVCFLLGAAFVLFAYPSADRRIHAKGETLPSLTAFLKDRETWIRLRGAGIAVCIAVMLLQCMRYQNGLVNLHHDIAERAMLTALAVMLLLISSGRSFERISTALAGLWAAGASAVCIILYYRNRVRPEDSLEFAEENLAYRYLLAAVAVTGVAVIVTAAELVRRLRQFRSVQGNSILRYAVRKANLLFAVPAVLFLVLSLVFRNTRGWTVLIVLYTALFFIRFLLWEYRDRWPGILAAGIVLHFLCHVAYCFCHRYFLSYLYTRYSMGFHTVTVTAVYITVVLCAALALLVRGWRRYCRERADAVEMAGGPGRMALYLWKELSVMALALSYLIFTMSRTGIAAAAFMLFAVLILLILCGRGAGTRAPSAILLYLLMAAGTVWMFPQAYTAQRIIPAVVSEPDLFPIENYPEEVMRGRHVGSVYYISIERFATILSNKLFGTEEARFAFTMDPDRHTWEETEYEITPERAEEIAAFVAETGIGTYAAALGDRDPGEVMAEEQAAAGDGAAEDASAGDTAGTDAADGSIEEYANGRMDYFRAYLSRLDMKGHDEMGAELPDGELAVHAHNTYLQVAYDHGILTGIVFILMLAAGAICGAMYYNRAGRRHGGITILPFAAALAFMMTGMVEWVYHLCNPMTLLLFMSCAPLLVREEHE